MMLVGLSYASHCRHHPDAIRLLYVSAQEPAVIWVLCLLLLVFGCFKWNSVDSIKVGLRRVSPVLAVPYCFLLRKLPTSNKPI